MSSIGIVKSIFSRYYDVSIIAVDWLINIQFPGCFAADLLVALPIFNEKIRLRKLLVAVSTGSVFI